MPPIVNALTGLWRGQYSLTIAHDDVLTLTDDPKPGFL
jgi:hypothetical protein